MLTVKNTPHSNWYSFNVNYGHNMEAVFDCELQKQTGPKLSLHANEYVQSCVNFAQIYHGVYWRQTNQPHALECAW